MPDLQERIQNIDSKIKKLTDKKNTILKKKRDKIIQLFEQKNLIEWHEKILESALTYIQKQKELNSEQYKNWEKQNDTTQKNRPKNQPVKSQKKSA